MDTITVGIETDPRTGERYVSITQHTEGYSPESDACIYPSREQVEQLASDLIDALYSMGPATTYGYA